MEMINFNSDRDKELQYQKVTDVGRSNAFFVSKTNGLRRICNYVSTIFYVTNNK